jgi:hypothetical protein
VRVRRLADGVLLEPLITDAAEWFAELDRVRAGQFLGKSKERSQPVTPRREIFK